ncbi:hypothetical protein AAHZ94_21315, partial [Streptomyces sp. HSW2009]
MGEQLALIRETVRKTKVPKAKPRTWRGAPLAKELPVARVLVDKGPVHLDKLWDYAVPAELDATALPGVRVRVRFGAGTGQVRGGRREGGGLLDGYILERVAESDYRGPLAVIAQVLSPPRGRGGGGPRGGGRGPAPTLCQPHPTPSTPWISPERPWS